MKHYFEKEPTERVTLEIDLTERLPDGAAPVTVAVTATDPTSGAAAAILPSASGSASGSVISFTVFSGVGQSYYNVRALTTLDNSDVLEEDVVLRVK